MRRILMAVWLCIPSTAQADLLCTRKADGSLFEHQSHGKIGTCAVNAVGSGVDPETITEQIISPAEWVAFTQTRAFDPISWDARLVEAAKPDPQAELEAAIQAATTLEELKAVLMGDGRTVKVGAKHK